jgi:hypothetical protein
MIKVPSSLECGGSIAAGTMAVLVVLLLSWFEGGSIVVMGTMAVSVAFLLSWFEQGDYISVLVLLLSGPDFPGRSGGVEATTNLVDESLIKLNERAPIKARLCPW